MKSRLCLSLLSMVLMPGVAAASGQDACKEFSVVSTGEFRQISQVDRDGDGKKSPGDKLVGFRVLQDSDGNHVGARYFIGQFHEFSPDGKDIRRTTEVVNVFRTGVIYTTKEKIGGKDLPSVINGGTGEFEGATGTVKMTREGTSNVYAFRINCGEEKDS